MLAKPPLVDGLVVNVHRGFGQEAIEAIGDIKLDCRGVAVLSSTGTPKLQSCTLCSESSHLRNHRRHWDALDAHRPHHGVVDIHKDHLRGHRCLTLALSGTQQAPRSGNLLLRVRDEQPVMRASLKVHDTPPRTQRPLSSSAHSELESAIAIFIGQPGAVSIRCSSDHARPKQ